MGQALFSGLVLYHLKSPCPLGPYVLVEEDRYCINKREETEANSGERE